jgi:hypothetical protein
MSAQNETTVMTQSIQQQVEALLKKVEKNIDDAIAACQYWAWNDIYNEFLTKLSQIQPAISTADYDDANHKVFQLFANYGIREADVRTDRDELIRRDIERQHMFDNESDDDYTPAGFTDNDNVDTDFGLPEEFIEPAPQQHQHQPQHHQQQQFAPHGNVFHATHHHHHHQDRIQIAYTSPSKNEPCPICYEDIEGECWVCEQCHQEFCRECCEHWFGSALEYAVPADEAGPVYMLQAENHNTACPHCRHELAH